MNLTPDFENFFAQITPTGCLVYIVMIIIVGGIYIRAAFAYYRAIIYMRTGIGRHEEDVFPISFVGGLSFMFAAAVSVSNDNFWLTLLFGGLMFWSFYLAGAVEHKMGPPV